MEKDCENIDRKEWGMVTLLSHKLHFRAKTITEEREGYYIMIKEYIHQKDISIINMYALNKVLYNMWSNSW